MGSEYVVQLDEQDAPTNIERLEELLSQLPHYFGKVNYPNTCAFQFRTAATKEDTNSMPDVDVVAQERAILVCQYGDYLVTIQVLGAIIAEYVSETKAERLEVFKP